MQLVNDEPVISYVLESGSLGEVKLATYLPLSKGFKKEKLANFNLYGPANFDVFNDAVYLIFHDHGLNGGGLNFLSEELSEWISMDASNEGHDGWDSDIKVLESNKIFTSSIDAIPFNGLGLEFSSYDGTSWKTDTVGTTAMNYGYGTSLEIDDLENPHIFHHNTTSKALEYAYKENNKWNIDTIDSIGEAGFYPVSVMKNDIPIIAYLSKVSNTEAAVKLAIETSRGVWGISILDTISNFDFTLMGRRPLDIYLGDSLHIVAASTKQLKEYVLGKDYVFDRSDVILKLDDQDSSFSQTASFKKDEEGFKHYTIGLILSGEENIYYGTNRIGFYNIANSWNVINIYPNPVTNYLTIEGVSGNVSLYNSMGVEIFKIDLELINKIDLSFLSAGVYYLKSNNKYASIIKK